MASEEQLSHSRVPEKVFIHIFFGSCRKKMSSGAIQFFTDTSNEGPHLGDCTAKLAWSIPESKLHKSFLLLKAVLMALKESEPLCIGQVVLVASNNTTVVVYINQAEGKIKRALGFFS